MPIHAWNSVVEQFQNNIKLIRIDNLIRKLKRTRGPVPTGATRVREQRDGKVNSKESMARRGIAEWQQNGREQRRSRSKVWQEAGKTARNGYKLYCSYDNYLDEWRPLYHCYFITFELSLVRPIVGLSRLLPVSFASRYSDCFSFHVCARSFGLELLVQNFQNLIQFRQSKMCDSSKWPLHQPLQQPIRFKIVPPHSGAFRCFGANFFKIKMANAVKCKFGSWAA